MLHRTIQVVTGTLSGLAVVALLLWTGLIGPTNDPYPFAAHAPQTDYPAPPLSLRTTAGEPFALDRLQGEVALVFFGFANCPDVCPLTLLHWTHALEELRARGLDFQGIFVTVDPVRDTPPALDRWMEGFHPSFIGLTGTQEEVWAAAADWGVYVQITEAREATFPEASEGTQAESPDGAETDPHADPHAGAQAEPPPGAETDRPSGAQADPHAGHFGLSGDPSETEYFVNHSTRTFVVDREGRVVQTLLAHLDGPELVEILVPLLSR